MSLSVHSAGSPDVTALIAFLRANVDGAMFPPTNLLQHGQDSHASRGMSFQLTLKAGQIIGAKRAVLASANRAASCAYEAIGFHHIGVFALQGFSGPLVPHGGKQNG